MNIYETTIKTLIATLVAIPLIGQQLAILQSLEKEQALGNRLASQVRQQARPFEGPVADAYLKRIAGTLLAHVPEKPFPFRFELMSTDTNEPLPLPGGYIFVPADFFLSVQDEGEFACMLGHTIAHSVLRHGIRAARQQETVPAPVPLIFIGGGHADLKSSIVIPRGSREAQRTNELEADKFALELSALAGYDASGCRRYIARTQPPDLQAQPVPAREVRLANMDEVLGALPSAPASSPDELLHVQQTIRASAVKAENRPTPTLRR